MSDLSGIPNDQLAFLLAEEETRRAHAVWEATKAAEEVGRIKAELVKRLTPGEVLLVDDHVQVVCLPPRAGNRSVDKEAVLRHAESLEPLGLAPREVVHLAWPTVSQITAGAYAIERCGIDHQELLIPGAVGEPRIELREVKETHAAVPAAPTEEGHDERARRTPAPS